MKTPFKNQTTKNMKKLVLLLTTICFLSIKLHSQGIEFGMKAGLNSIDLASEGISIFTKDNNEFKLAFHEANYGVHFGLYSRIDLMGLFIEPSFLFNSNSVNYRLDNFTEGGLSSSIKNENYNNLDIPVMVGIRLFFIRIYGGPVAHLHLNSTSDIFDIEGYDQQFKDATYGYQLGAGLDLWNLRVQLNYEGNSSNFGDHIIFEGNPYAFDNGSSRWIASLGVKF